MENQDDSDEIKRKSNGGKIGGNQSVRARRNDRLRDSQEWIRPALRTRGLLEGGYLLDWRVGRGTRTMSYERGRSPLGKWGERGWRRREDTRPRHRATWIFRGQWKSRKNSRLSEDWPRWSYRTFNVSCRAIRVWYVAWSVMIYNAPKFYTDDSARMVSIVE